jgi:hypothetical protein
MSNKALKGLGLQQLELLSKLARGHYVHEVITYGEPTISGLHDEDGNVYDFNKKALASLVHRGLVKEERIYSTVMPDTDHYRYDIAPEHLEAVRYIFPYTETEE